MRDYDWRVVHLEYICWEFTERIERMERMRRGKSFAEAIDDVRRAWRELLRVIVREVFKR